MTEDQSTAEDTRIRRFWDQIFAGSKMLNAKDLQYFTDTSVPWTKESGRHVFVPANNTFLPPFGSATYTEAQQDEIILAIIDALGDLIGQDAMEQPPIHFEGQEVHVSGLNSTATRHLWNSPPVLREKPMKFVSRGLSWPQPYVMSFHGGTAMKKDAFIEAFEKQYSNHRAKTHKETGLHAAFARFYDIKSLPGGPVFAGQVLMFNNGTNIGETVKPFFVKQHEEQNGRFAFSSKVREPLFKAVSKTSSSK